MLRIPFRRRSAGLGVALALALCARPGVSLAAVTDDELKDLRAQIQQLRDQYEQRINALEQRLQAAEQNASQANAAATQANTAATQASTAATQASSTATQAGATADQAMQQAQAKQSSEGAFNPAVSLILNGTYGNLSSDPNHYRINGFVPSNGDVAPPPRSFSLGESELALSANVDPYFRGAANIALEPDNTVSVEEANVQTLGLGNGLSLKIGRFFQAIGYLNEQHAHVWDFTDASLANKVFLGGQLADDGVQMLWVAPTDLYMDAGLELGRGRYFPGGPVGGRSKNGAGSANLFTHVGGDLGDSTSWKVGLSHLATRAEDREYQDFDSTGATVTDAFNGASRLWTLGGILKWAPNGDATVHNFKLQGEYFNRSESGSLTYDTTAASLGTQTGAYSSRQSGWYAQGVYQFMPQWRVGYRYDRLDSGNAGIGLVASGALTAADFPVLSSYNPVRNTVMLDWSGSEFSRIRLQLSREQSQPGLTDNQVFLQYIMSLGAHGAHNF